MTYIVETYAVDENMREIPAGYHDRDRKAAHEDLLKAILDQNERISMLNRDNLVEVKLSGGPEHGYLCTAFYYENGVRVDVYLYL